MKIKVKAIVSSTSHPMKDSGVEWVGLMPENWELKRLQHHLIEIKEKNNPIQTTRVLSLTNKLGVIPYEEKGNQGNKAKEDYSQYGIAFENTLVINSMNVLIGSVGISHYYGCVSPVYYVFDNCDNTDLRFVNYIFQTDGFQKELRKYANGILEIRLRVSAHDMLRRLIPTPSFHEQVLISDYLDAECARIDYVIEKTRESIEEYKKLKQSIIAEAVTKGIRQNREMKDSGEGWLGLIPVDWNCIRIKWLLNERKEKSSNGTEEPLSMSQKYGLIPTRDMDTIPNMAASFIGAKLCYQDDLVFNKLKAHLGVFSVSNYDGLVSPDYAVYYSTGKTDLKYLEYVFKTPQCISEFTKKTTGVGAGLMRLYTPELYSIRCPLPPQNEQNEIVMYLNTKVKEIDTLIYKKERSIEELISFKQSLIYEYVTGKKEVSA